VAAAREAIGPEKKLLLDANQAWDLGEAEKRCRAFERYDITWIEEPLSPRDIRGHASLRQKTAIPVAIGESLYTIDEFHQYLLAGAVDIVQADIARVGGLTPWLAIADLAAAWCKPVAPHFVVELSLHALCAIENGLVLENVRGGALFDLGLAREPLRTAQGHGVPGETSGHGIEFEIDGNAGFEVGSTGYSFSSSRSHKGVAQVDEKPSASVEAR
jgi:L-alanine-DL-glutamate epimerase-like enolase superfamily enzyme